MNSDDKEARSQLVQPKAPRKLPPLGPLVRNNSDESLINDLENISLGTTTSDFTTSSHSHDLLFPSSPCSSISGSTSPWSTRSSTPAFRERLTLNMRSASCGPEIDGKLESSMPPVLRRAAISTGNLQSASRSSRQKAARKQRESFMGSPFESSAPSPRPNVTAEGNQARLFPVLRKMNLDSSYLKSNCWVDAKEDESQSKTQSNLPSI